MMTLVSVLTARYFWISRSIPQAVLVSARSLSGRKGLVELAYHPAAAGQDEDHENEDEQEVGHEGQERAEGGDEERPEPADVEVLDPLGQTELEARVGNERVDPLQERPDHLRVGRQLRSEGLAAGVEHGADEIEDQEGQEEDEDQGQGFRDLPADEDVEDRRDGKGEEQRQRQGDEDRPGQPQEHAEQEEDDDAGADLEPPVLVHVETCTPILAKIVPKGIGTRAS